MCLGTQDRTLNHVTGLLKSYLKESSHNMFHTFEEVEEAVRRLLAEEQGEKERGDAVNTTVSGIVSQLVSLYWLLSFTFFMIL